MDDLLVEGLAGLGVGACMGLVGAGGAIFTVPLFAAALGHGAKSAFVEALAVTGAVAAASGALAARRGLVDWRRALTFGIAGIAGAQAAAPVAVRIDQSMQVGIFAAVAAAAAWRMWASAGGETSVVGDAAGPRACASAVRWRSTLVGALIGALTSLIGVGGGFVLIPALVVVEHLPMRLAVGTSMVVISINAAAGLVGQWLYGTDAGVPFDTRTVAIVVACGIAGSVAGTGVQSRLPQALLRRIFAVGLLAAGAWMAGRSFMHR